MLGIHRKGAEAVIKIIYQIHASEETIDSYQDEIDMYKKDSARSAETQAELDDIQESLDQCRKPAPLPSKYTVDDMSALMEFHQHRTSCTPWLLDFVKMPLPAGVHRRGLVGGYLAIMLITKIPGAQLSSRFLKGLTLAERDHVREDSKKAFLEVRKCGIVPELCGLGNLKWDKENRTCYIMSFEEVSGPSAEERESQEMDDNVYKYWGVDEDV